HPAANSLAELNAHILECLRGFAYRQLEIEFLLGFVEQQERPVLRAQKFVDFLHDRAENLIELQGGGERLPQFLEDRHFARFSLFGRRAWIAAALDTRKLLDLLSAHWNLSPGRQQPAPATKKESRASTPIPKRTRLGQYRHPVKCGATWSWDRRFHLAMVAKNSMASCVFTCDSVNGCSRLAVRSSGLGTKECQRGLSKLRRRIQKHWPMSTVWHDPQGRSRNGTIHFYRHLHRIEKATISRDY